MSDPQSLTLELEVLAVRCSVCQQSAWTDVKDAAEYDTFIKIHGQHQPEAFARVLEPEEYRGQMMVVAFGEKIHAA